MHKKDKFQSVKDRRNYVNVHYWLLKNYGKATICCVCKSDSAKRYEWALIKGKQYDKDVNNFMPMCKSCHVKYDMTEETKAKFKNNNLGKKRSELTKQKMSESHKRVDKSYLVGRTIPEDVRQKISKSITGISRNKGVPKSEDHRNKISESLYKYYGDKNGGD